MFLLAVMTYTSADTALLNDVCTYKYVVQEQEQTLVSADQNVRRLSVTVWHAIAGKHVKLSIKYKYKTLWIIRWLFHDDWTLTMPGPSAGVSGSLDSYCSLKPLCSGMGEVVPARTSPTLLPPSPRTVLSLSCFKVSQCINCRDWHCKS